MVQPQRRLAVLHKQLVPKATSVKPGPKLAPDADLSQVAKERGIEFFFVAFVDVFGVLRSKMVPAEAISQIQRDGAGFAPFATWHNYGPDAKDMLAIPDASTLIQVPFQPEIGFVIGDCYIGGEKVMDNPRWVLKEQVERAAAKGYEFKTGVEPEFFLLSEGEQIAIADAKDTKDKPCYETGALLRRYGCLKEIVRTLIDSGLGVYQTDHEDANGQFEINWHYGNCLTTADQHVYFKWVVKALAERHGMQATFMPRPFKNLTGNGCHCHSSLWSQGKNLFVGPSAEFPSLDCLGLSTQAYHFLGGVLSKARSCCAITNPTVNSYKRLAGAMTNSGSTWSPNRISLSGNNRSHMVRVPENDRFELRVADGAVNPYLLQAVVLASGLWGMEHKKDPRPYFFTPDVNMYLIPDGAPEIAKLETMPANMLDALRALEADTDLVAMFGATFMTCFLKLKKAEWREFTGHLTDWELEKTLDC